MAGGTVSAPLYQCSDGSFSTTPCEEPGGTVQTPLVVVETPQGLVITHAAPGQTVNQTLTGLLDGQFLGIDKKLIALGVLAYFVFAKGK